MKSADLIGLAIVAVVLVAEYLIAKRIVLPNWLLKIMLAVFLPLVILIATCALQPVYYTLGIVGVTCILSMPFLLFALHVKKKDVETIEVLHIGDIVSFTGRKYASVGYQYYLEFDNTAFKMETQVKDLYKPKKEDFVIDGHGGECGFRRPCGGDEMEVTYNLTAVKRGVFEIHEIVEFRDVVESEKIHRIKVK